MDKTNPKDLIGATKDNVDLVPVEGILGIARAMKNGADKYGAFNWRENKVQYKIYLAAILRHTYALLEREDIAEDSGCHHLDHIGANICILKDAMKYNSLIDNRPPRPPLIVDPEVYKKLQKEGIISHKYPHQYPDSYACSKKKCRCKNEKKI